MPTGVSRSELQPPHQSDNKPMCFPLNFFSWVVSFSLILSFPVANSDPRVTQASSLICGTGRATTQSLIPTFVQSMERLSSNLSNSYNSFVVATITAAPLPPFYALIQCHRDLSRTDCLVCYAVARTAVPGCLPRTSGRIFLDGCFVRYDNYGFFDEAVDPATDARNCSSSLASNNWNDFAGGYSEFNRSVWNLTENLAQSAVTNGGFRVMESNGVYGLAQCWQSVSSENCSVCLNKAKTEAVGCLPSREGRSMNAGCFLRYSTQKFYDNDSYRGNSGVAGGVTWKVKLAIGFAAALLSFALVIIIYSIMKSSKRNFLAWFKHKTEDDRIVEAFIMQYGSLGTKRYTYADIKKMTNSFKVKLGQGGFGTVFKGKLTDGRIVAVKLLNSSKASGREFINEVASIGRTSHINIVTLLGFCFSYRKRALVYEFMPNGSLEKFIHKTHDPMKTSELIGVEKLYEIGLGIARGLDYLYRGCNTRILHLDIKPHNVLLDEDFCPKIADFGLAKLYSKKESIVSIMEARGTIGYIAPEVFNKNFGGVSHKADVYSYGMLLLEMVGGRKNPDSGDTSDIYFPYWIYSRLEKDEYLADRVTTAEENEYARKMTIVGLWCIQADPNQRPSINEVIDMLEGSMEALEIPPKPFFGSPLHFQASTFNESQSEITLEALKKNLNEVIV